MVDVSVQIYEVRYAIMSGTRRLELLIDNSKEVVTAADWRKSPLTFGTPTTSSWIESRTDKTLVPTKLARDVERSSRPGDSFSSDEDCFDDDNYTPSINSGEDVDDEGEGVDRIRHRGVTDFDGSSVSVKIVDGEQLDKWCNTEVKTKSLERRRIGTR